MDVLCVWTTLVLHLDFCKDFPCSKSCQHPCEVPLGSSCPTLHCDGWRGGKGNAPGHVQWMCTKAGRFMRVRGLEVTKVTSKSEELRLQGDQPYRGLCSVAGGI